MTPPRPLPPICLGVDPGTRVTGFGIVTVERNRYSSREHGCIRPSRTFTPAECRNVIFREISTIIAKHQPQMVAIETQFVDRNPRSSLLLAMVRSVIILAATLSEIPIYEYSPSSAKKAICGRGQATKEQVQAMCQRLLSLTEPPPSDAADALAIACCHLHRNPVPRHV